MTCHHGNWSPCEQCEEELARSGANAPCPKCGAPCKTTVAMRGGDHGWGTSDKERTQYRYSAPPAAVVSAEPVALLAAARRIEERIAYYAKLAELGQSNIEQWAYTDVSGDIAALRAAIAAAPVAPDAVDGWRPIETAPKDGTEMLLSNGETSTLGWWMEHEGGTTEFRDVNGNYLDQWDDDGYIGWWDVSGGMQPEPTHWMPLPAAPTAALASTPSKGAA